MFNQKLTYMSVPDRGIWLLNELGIKMSQNETLSIKFLIRFSDIIYFNLNRILIKILDICLFYNTRKIIKILVNITILV